MAISLRSAAISTTPAEPTPAESQADSLAAYDFQLPPGLIAQTPARPRDSARLLEVNGNDLHDRCVRDLPELLRHGDLLVVNDTRVIPAQLTGWRGAARVGVTLDRPLPDGSWHALGRNTRRLRAGDRLAFHPALSATLCAAPDGGSLRLRFDQQGADFDAGLRQAGALALPPYIARPRGPLPQDAADYQTLFAAREGAVAAPTAGLHFTPALMAALRARGVGLATITLHVGAGTFLPVRASAIEAHRMHAERGTVCAAAVAQIRATRAAGGRIAAVGTTTVRLLEAASASGALQPFDGETDIFLRPGHRFESVDLLITNFHLPRSTLFMLVCAFAGAGPMRAAYAHAIAENYRFYSYGDATLLHRA
jgi:S-adenosylmethionine:tRNA ribosyltransferase-isomerase